MTGQELTRMGRGFFREKTEKSRRQAGNIAPSSGLGRLREKGLLENVARSLSYESCHCIRVWKYDCN